MDDGNPRAADGPEAGGEPSVLLVLASAGWGGTEKAFVQLAAALVGRQRVSVAIPPDAVFHDRLPSGLDRVVGLPSGSRRNPSTLLAVRRMVRELDPDVVHTHAARATEMLFWAGRGLRAEHVATKHNTRDRWIFSRVAHVTAVSRQAARSIRRRPDVRVVYNAVQVPAVPARPPPDPFTLLGVGRLHRHKGFDSLVRALAVLDSDVVLQIAGEGPERGALERLVDELGLRGRVVLLGHREDVPELMAGAHALVVPSRNEGFGLALVEGLLLCPAVLSTRVGIAPEVLPERLLVSEDGMAAALRALKERYPDFVAASAAARAEVMDRFSIRAMVEGYAAVYREASRRSARDGKLDG